MKNILLAFVFMIFSCFAFANNQIYEAGFEKLTAAQKAQVIATIEAQAQETANQSTSVAKVEQYVNIGERFGKMIGSAAKETGIAVNEFMSTPAGIMASALIVWNYAGKSLLLIAGFFTLLILGILILYRGYNIASPYVYEYDTEKTDVFGRSRIKKKYRETFDNGVYSWFWVPAAVMIVASFFCIAQA